MLQTHYTSEHTVDTNRVNSNIVSTRNIIVDASAQCKQNIHSYLRRLKLLGYPKYNQQIKLIMNMLSINELRKQLKLKSVPALNGYKTH